MHVGNILSMHTVPIKRLKRISIDSLRNRPDSSKTPRVMPHCTSGWSLLVVPPYACRHRTNTLRPTGFKHLCKRAQEVTNTILAAYGSRTCCTKSITISLLDRSVTRPCRNWRSFNLNFKTYASILMKFDRILFSKCQFQSNIEMHLH